MKVRKKNNKEIFQPVTIEIVLETKDEVAAIRDMCFNRVGVLNFVKSKTKGWTEARFLTVSSFLYTMDSELTVDDY